MATQIGRPYKPQVDDDNDVELASPRQGKQDQAALQEQACEIELPTDIRQGFIRKVYGILSAQMFVTVVFCSMSMFIAPMRHGIIKIFSVPGMQIIVFIPTMCVLCALHKYKSQHPTNYQLLAAFTFLMALPLGFVCAAYYAHGLGHLILQAAMLTMVCFGGLTAYTVLSGKNFSWMGAGLSTGLLVLVFWGFLASIFGLGGGLIYSSFGALLFCGFIVYDTWRVMQEYGCDDAILASIELYLDIVNLFLYILQILSELSQGGDS